MSSIIRPIAGEKIAIGTAFDGIVPDDDDIALSNFTGGGITYTDIDGWLTKGAFGDTRTEVSENPINRRRTATTGGTSDGGTMQNTFLNIRDDPGQIACKAALKTDYDYPIRITSNDAPAGVGSTPTIEYFYARVTSFNYPGGGANTSDQVQITFRVNSAIIEVPADEA
jgi:hypothetical protein